MLWRDVLLLLARLLLNLESHFSCVRWLVFLLRLIDLAFSFRLMLRLKFRLALVGLLLMGGSVRRGTLIGLLAVCFGPVAVVIIVVLLILAIVWHLLVLVLLVILVLRVVLLLVVEVLVLLLSPSAASLWLSFVHL
jgi:hypothetical protein